MRCVYYQQKGKIANIPRYGFLSHKPTTNKESVLQMKLKVDGGRRSGIKRKRMGLHKTMPRLMSPHISRSPRYMIWWWDFWDELLFAIKISSIRWRSSFVHLCEDFFDFVVCRMLHPKYWFSIHPQQPIEGCFQKDKNFHIIQISHATRYICCVHGSWMNT